MVSLFVEDPHALPSMQSGELGTGTCGIRAAVVARWSVAGSGASASGDDSVV